MKIKTITCPNCNANLQVNWSPGIKTCFCTYCGSQLYIDNEEETINYNYTYHEIDDARIREAEVDREVKLRRIESSEKTTKQMIMFIVFGMLLMLLIYVIMLVENHYRDYTNDKNGRIKVPNSSSYYEDIKKYEQAVTELENAGFENIETVPLEDLKLGIISKENSVSEISIAGKTSFEEGEYFDKDSAIIIYYHSFPE